MDHKKEIRDLRRLYELDEQGRKMDHTDYGQLDTKRDPELAREMEIPNLLDQIDRALELLDDNASRLSNRLSPVLALSKPSPAAGDSLPTDEAHTELGARLSRTLDLIRNVSDRLNDTSFRLEL